MPWDEHDVWLCNSHGSVFVTVADVITHLQNSTPCAIYKGFYALPVGTPLLGGTGIVTFPLQPDVPTTSVFTASGLIVPAKSNLPVTVVFPQAFADANYTVLCEISPASGLATDLANIVFDGTTTKTSTGCIVVLGNRASPDILVNVRIIGLH